MYRYQDSPAIALIAQLGEISQRLSFSYFVTKNKSQENKGNLRENTKQTTRDVRYLDEVAVMETAHSVACERQVGAAVPARLPFFSFPLWKCKEHGKFYMFTS